MISKSLQRTVHLSFNIGALEDVSLFYDQNSALHSGQILV